MYNETAGSAFDQPGIESFRHQLRSGTGFKVRAESAFGDAGLPSANQMAAPAIVKVPQPLTVKETVK